jgi:hypothetical protein
MSPELIKIINKAFWKLCDTPQADKATKERQKAYSQRKNKNL